MKLKAEHIKILREAITPFMNADTAALYAEQGLTPKRYRWDALWSANKVSVPLREIMPVIYRYANDEHIDTVLRMLDTETSNKPSQ